MNSEFMCYIVVYGLENIFTEHMASQSKRINIKWSIDDGSVWLAKIDLGSLGKSSVAVRILRRRECHLRWCFLAIRQLKKERQCLHTSSLHTPGRNQLGKLRQSAEDLDWIFSLKVCFSWLNFQFPFPTVGVFID